MNKTKQTKQINKEIKSKIAIIKFYISCSIDRAKYNPAKINLINDDLRNAYRELIKLEEGIK